MKSYYVNKQAQSNGDHEVHTSDCRYLPSLLNRKAIGHMKIVDLLLLKLRKRIRNQMDVKPVLMNVILVKWVFASPKELTLAVV